ncbi:MAG: DEAD/DEAH box helicase [Candidatus Woesearchaeota archaeon]
MKSKEKKILLEKFEDEFIVNKLLQFPLRKFQKESLKYIFDKNVLICAPTGSGKSWIAEVASFYCALKKKKKAIYAVPLKALARERYEKFLSYNIKDIKIALTTSDYDESSDSLKNYDIIIATSEKIDSILRHNAYWLDDVALFIADEIHLLNDIERGPVLEYVITSFKLKGKQIIGLSATIGNAEQVADWLKAKLIISKERPVKLYYGVLNNNKIYYLKETS